MRTRQHSPSGALRALALRVLGALLPLLLLGGVAHAQDPKAQAKQHFAAGEARFKAGDYRAAITEFAAADALVPSPILSYNIGLCHERLGEDELAVQRYRDYLTRRPDAANRPQVEERIQQAEQRIAARMAPPAPAPAGPPAPAAQPPPPGEGPAAPRPPTEGPVAPAPPAPGGAVDESLAKRLPTRPAPAPAGPAAPAPAGPAASTPNSDLSRLAGTPGTSTGGDAEAAPEPAPVPGAPLEKHSDKKAKPLYKEWWFWAVVGVSAIIVIDMLNDSGSSTNALTPEAQSGAVLLRF